MSEITTHERPGVYSSYEASALTAAADDGGAVAIVAAAGDSAGDGPYCWTSYSRALSDVGKCALSELAKLALKNGETSMQNNLRDITANINSCL